MKKKGITLIEIVIAMALVFILVGVIDRMLVSYLKNYRNSVVQNKGFNYLSEAIAITISIRVIPFFFINSNLYRNYTVILPYH